MVDAAAPVLWIDPPAASAELALARSWVASLARVIDATSPAEAVSAPPSCLDHRSPTVILVASPAVSGWRLDDFLAISRRWPLAPVVSVAATLVEGRRRSGPALPGVEEVSWTDLPGRLAWWILDRSQGLPGTLGMPATARRDERILEAMRRVAQTPPASISHVEVAASRQSDLEAVADLISAAGHQVIGRRVGRPPIDHRADAVVWDAGELDSTQITWLGMLAANRPATPVIALDSFPRADTTSAAMRAGAAAVLARPAALDVISGVLLHVTSRGRLSACD